jgi:hypothetical protein
MLFFRNYILLVPLTTLRRLGFEHNILVSIGYKFRLVSESFDIFLPDIGKVLNEIFLHFFRNDCRNSEPAGVSKKRCVLRHFVAQTAAVKDSQVAEADASIGRITVILIV